MKTKLINSLIWKYTGILKEVVIQKDLYKNQSEYLTTLVKIQSYINLIHSIQLRNILINQ